MTWYWWQLVQTFIWGWLGPLSEILAVKGRKLFCKANVLPFLSGIEKRKCKNEKLLHERVENPQSEIEFLYQKLLRAYTHRVDITECLSPISNMDFQFWAIWAPQGSKGKISIMNYELLLSSFFMFSATNTLFRDNFCGMHGIYIVLHT